MRIFRSWVYCVALTLAAGLLYAPFFNNPIVFDDMHFFIVGGGMQANYAEFTPQLNRWLPYATIAWTVNMFGMNMLPLRIEAWLLHSAVGIALFFFIQRLYIQVFSGKWQQPSNLPLVWAVFFSALLFLLHPAAVYGAAYLVQRTTVMATLFGVLSLHAYLRGLSENKPNWLWLSVLWYLFAAMAKSHIIMLPAVILALTILLKGFSLETVRKLKWIILGYVLVAIFVITNSWFLGIVYEPNAVDMLERVEIEHGYLFSVLTQCGLFFKYIFLWMVPNPQWMSVDMREPFANTLWSFYGLGLIGFVTYGVVASKMLLRRGSVGLVGFSLLVPWLFFFTEFSVIRIQESFVLYRSYLWMIGLFIMLPLLFQKAEAKFIAIVLFCVALIFAALSVDRLVTFKHRFLLWDDAARLVDGKANIVGADRIYANRGQTYKDMLSYPEAIKDFQLAISLRPKFGYYHHSIAVAYLEMGDFKQAINEFEKSIVLAPDNMRGFYGIGLSYVGLKRMDLARENFLRSCEKGLTQGCDKVKSMDSTIAK